MHMSLSFFRHTIRSLNKLLIFLGLICQVEMSEIRSIIAGTTNRSLVLIDEICRGTETAKGTCIAGSIIETLDKIGCIGIVSTHLHGIFTLPLVTKNTVYKAMGTAYVDGKAKPTWKLTDGICRESLAFETAIKEGIPQTIIQRAEGLYLSVFAKEVLSGQTGTNLELCSNTSINGSDEAPIQSSRIREGAAFSKTKLANPMQVLQKEVENAVMGICQKKLIELYKKKNISELAEVQCVLIGARERPPPSTIGASSVYVMLRADKKLYVGEVLSSDTIYLIAKMRILGKLSQDLFWDDYHTKSQAILFHQYDQASLLLIEAIFVLHTY